MTDVRVLARAQWPEPGDAGPPTPIPGFVVSSFAPLVAEVAARCLGRWRAVSPGSTDSHTGVVLAATYGDRGTANAIVDAVDTGRRVPPMLFFQSVPNAVLGHVAARWGLTGPVASIGPVGDATAEGLAVAEGFLLDGDATAVLLIVVDQRPDPAVSATATAMLVEPRDRRPTEGGNDD
jgi:hypothetical protein